MHVDLSLRLQLVYLFVIVCFDLWPMWLSPLCNVLTDVAFAVVYWVVNKLYGHLMNFLYFSWSLVYHVYYCIFLLEKMLGQSSFSLFPQKKGPLRNATLQCFRVLLSYLWRILTYNTIAYYIFTQPQRIIKMLLFKL